ncbi:L-lactate dehydrogenase [Paenibacillus polymyxa]|uniref:L-lactate dehydrogenase n=1 Tax=Paenibacillus TaxID=44249 RepID=UPI0002EAB26C|nr:MULTISPECIES: L-lactate dehydrogenase [Paenibacillus]MCV9952108.1 L-lactate dehydrogenase [Paenibacillus sp. BT-177]AHM64138.1 L-lactate dehydrogenase 3 [Paenibacillus polymyxa SQR-21]AIY09827.1 lactate dehydrogenase [Paenibacillus polymyxa]KAE8560088.1 L-lactate dehydrogenase [Paenibacillus polymyxa]KAF6579623.1 L-lactate dehydrogenase [Paenibacillus sp. EKM211P]
MKGKARKVAIVGAGMVGSSCAYSMVNQSICDEIMMIDRTYDRALAHALDLSHCMDFTSTRTKVRAGTYADCTDMDVVIITAGSNPKPGQDRLSVLDDAVHITREIVTAIMEGGFDGIFVIAANPVDIVTYLVQSISGLPRNKVIGTGTSIDSSRLKTLLSEVFSIDPRSVQGYALGEHGESQFVAWSHVTIGGKPLLHILRQHKERFRHVDLDDIARKTRDAGWEIFTRKGATYFGIANALAYITRSILNDDGKIIAISAVLDGEYGHTDVCTGVPAIIGSRGIQEVIELELSPEEQAKFDASCRLISDNIRAISGLV